MRHGSRDQGNDSGEAEGGRKVGRWAGCLKHSGVIPSTSLLSLKALYIAPMSCTSAAPVPRVMTFRLRQIPSMDFGMMGTIEHPSD